MAESLREFDLKIMLIFPSQYIPISPYLSLPSLTAYLQGKGLTVIQRDFNVETYDLMLTKEYLEKIYERVCRSFSKLDSKNELSAAEQKYYDALFATRALAPGLIRVIDEAKRVFRSRRDFYDFGTYCRARKDICHALELISAAYYPTELGFSSFRMGKSRESSRRVMGATLSREKNPFIEIYEENFLPQVHREEPDIIGISVVDYAQIIPGLTLARLLKSSDCKAHITIGGSVFSRLVDILPQRREMFSVFFDSVIVYEGERPLLELAESVSTGRSLSRVPNLVYQDGAKVCVNEICHPETIDSLPTPCFDGFPLDLYFSPQPILPLLSARGCYWHKCAFCDHGYIYNGRYELRNGSKVVDDLQSLSKRYNTRYFAFSDEAISPEAFEVLSEGIAERGLEVNCLAHARFESQFTQELCRSIAKAGFRCLYLGLESGCDRVLSYMKKGTSRKIIEAVLRNSAESGIWNHVFLFFGFPTETEEEAQETIEFVFGNRRFINSLGSGTFSLGRHSQVMMHPESYGIAEVRMDANRDFANWYYYTMSAGLTMKRAQEIRANFNERLPEEYNDFSIWGNLLHREHLLLYLIYYGTNDLSSVVSESKSIDEEVVILPEDPVWPVLKPRLKDGVIYDTLSFDLTEIQKNIEDETEAELRRQQTHVVYNTNNLKIVSITPPAKHILELCNGRADVHQIVSKIADMYSISVNYARPGCIDFLKDMVNGGFVLV